MAVAEEGGVVEVDVVVVVPLEAVEVVPPEGEVGVDDDELSPDNIMCITRTLHLFFHSVLLSVKYNQFI